MNNKINKSIDDYLKIESTRKNTSHSSWKAIADFKRSKGGGVPLSKLLNRLRNIEQ